MTKDSALSTVVLSTMRCCFSARLPCLFTSLLLCLVFIGCRTKQEAAPEAAPTKGQVNASIELQHLNLGENVAKALPSGATHAYQIDLNSGQEIHLSLDKGDLN